MSDFFGLKVPFLSHLGVKAEMAEDGRSRISLELRPELMNRFEVSHGGVMTSDMSLSFIPNIEARIVKDGDYYVINRRKWWSSGAPDPRYRNLIPMGKTDSDNPSRHNQQSMILVPMDTPSVTRVRAPSVFGYDHAPHGYGEMLFENVRMPVSNVLLGEGHSIEIAQGHIHHCKRLIGLAERALELMCKRALKRVAFHKPIAKQELGGYL